MDFRELQYILAIAEQESISKAADQLYIAQPTLSRFLQTHEKLLGSKLFQRVGGRLVPTYFGERYLDYARQIMYIKNQMDQELCDITYQRKGRLNLACPRHRRDGIVLLSVMEFKSKYPNIEVNILESDTTSRIESLIKGEADIAIVYPPNQDPGLTYEPLLREELVFCVPPNHPLAHTGVSRPDCRYPWVDIRLFKKESFILQPPTSISGRLSEQIFKNAGISPEIPLRTTSLHGTLEAVSKGYSCAFIPDLYIKYTPLTPLPALFSLGVPCSTMELTAAYNTNTYHPKYMMEYLQILKQVASTQLSTPEVPC